VRNPARFGRLIIALPYPKRVVLAFAGIICDGEWSKIKSRQEHHG
jgi:hypothetical protein